MGTRRFETNPMSEGSTQVVLRLISLLAVSAALLLLPPIHEAQAGVRRLPAIRIRSAKVIEADSKGVKALFEVRLSRRADAQVRFKTAKGSAVAGDDYEPESGTLTFAHGKTSARIIVRVMGDLLDEPKETFLVKLSRPRNATIADGTGLGTITDDDTPSEDAPTLSIGDATVTEGNTSTTKAAFSVMLSAASVSTVVVDYATTNGSATGADYLPTSGTITFGPGITAKTVNVEVVGDATFEPNEAFSVSLSKAVNAFIEDGTALGTITNDDVTGGSITIANATVTEGNTGTTNAVFNVALSIASSSTVTVDYATVNGSASAPADYVSDSGTLTFTPGEVGKQIAVQVAGDTLVEPNETFSVNLSNPTNATIADDVGLGTITDNDMVTITIGNVTVTEVDAGTSNAVFNVTLSAASGSTVTVTYATVDGSATAGSDYNSIGATVLTFNPGQVSKQIIVQIVGDTVVEANETFSVNLSNPTNATIAGSGFGLGTINDDAGG